MYNFTFNIPTKIHFGKDTISSLSELKHGQPRILKDFHCGIVETVFLYRAASVLPFNEI